MEEKNNKRKIQILNPYSLRQSPNSNLLAISKLCLQLHLENKSYDKGKRGKIDISNFFILIRLIINKFDFDKVN